MRAHKPLNKPNNKYRRFGHMKAVTCAKRANRRSSGVGKGRMTWMRSWPTLSTSKGKGGKSPRYYECNGRKI